VVGDSGGGGGGGKAAVNASNSVGDVSNRGGGKVRDSGDDNVGDNAGNKVGDNARDRDVCGGGGGDRQAGFASTIPCGAEDTGSENFQAAARSAATLSTMLGTVAATASASMATTEAGMPGTVSATGLSATAAVMAQRDRRQQCRQCWGQ
jgi:hypothetical protein